jgi:DMSO/TMAO reductase YedYZ molybdopterin-dependent catalytic subunit
VTEFKCVEGWSTVVHWGGVRLLDFAAKFGLANHSGEPFDPRRRPPDLYSYVGLETPNDGYYVGLDMPSALHPQTLLCFEMNGRPLTVEHGAPLRLVSTVKYGYKQIKRIETIRFTDQRPRDYWAERGYDWYAGH